MFSSHEILRGEDYKELCSGPSQCYEERARGPHSPWLLISVRGSGVSYRTVGIRLKGMLFLHIAETASSSPVAFPLSRQILASTFECGNRHFTLEAFIINTHCYSKL